MVISSQDDRWLSLAVDTYVMASVTPRHNLSRIFPDLDRSGGDRESPQLYTVWGSFYNYYSGQVGPRLEVDISKQSVDNKWLIVSSRLCSPKYTSKASVRHRGCEFRAQPETVDSVGFEPVSHGCQIGPACGVNSTHNWSAAEKKTKITKAKTKN
ncbi:hypothetical protein RRG08_014873 [Elysia crispata]|uniref:Uncharacterized protein n=1 Tax=Elysia crispata TaxID=231223 RepID=A0AAE1AM98_9GAST|nr:hypothetical protein RRG08_014873 [Elysia crispata]